MSLHRPRRSPFESPSQKILSTRGLLRTVRNGVIVVAAVVLLIDLVGEPLLRWEYRYRGHRSEPAIFNATYLGVSGRREAYAGEYAEGCPLVLFVKPSPPLWRRAAESVLSLAP